MRPEFRVAAALLAAGVLPCVATAQEAIELDGIVVTASKTPKRAVDAPSASSSVGGAGARQKTGGPAAASNVDVVQTGASGEPAIGFGANGKSAFDKIQPQSVTDVLRDVPGVTTSTIASDPAQAVNIRGLQDFGRVNVMVDGARQNFQRTGHNANGAFYLEPEFLSSVDITRGPAANIYGSGAIGGVAAFTTRGINDILRADETSAIVQKVGVGTNGAGYVTSTSGGLRVGPNVDLYGQFVNRNTSPYESGNGVEVPDSGFDDYGGLGKIAVRPAAGHEVTATAMVQEYDFTDFTMTSAPSFMPIPQPVTNATDVTTENYTIGYTFARPDTPLIDFSAKAYYTTTKTDQDQSPVVSFSTRNFDIETTGFDIFNTSRFSTGAVAHRLTYGVDGFRDEVSVTDALGTGDLFTPSGERTAFGSFVEDELQLTPWLKAIGALRYDSYELDSDTVSKDGDRVSPKGTVAVTPVRGIELFATYAEGYRSPALTETVISGVHPPPAPFQFLPNADLEPEVGKTKEAGVNIKYDNVFTGGDKLRGKVAIFRNDVEDFIDLRLIACPPGVPAPFCAAQYQNVTEARIEGIEVEFGYDWGGGFLNIAGTLNDSEDRSTGKSLVTVPPDRLSTTLGFRFLDGRLIAGTRLHFVGASERDVDQLSQGFGSIFLPTDGYTLVDLFGSYQFNDWSALDVAINNVTDEHYRKFLDTDDSAGLQARAALTIKFGDKTGPLSSNW